MLNQKLKSDPRSIEQIQEHYEIEKQLAAQLRQASDRERTYLYTQLYDELYRTVPHHPQLLQKEDERSKQDKLASQLRILREFLTPQTVYLEVGPGDCNLALAVTQQVSQVYAIDVSTEITHHVNLPNNFQLIISDGCSIPVALESIDFTYSNQLMEHLHPQDAFRQLQNIYRALKPAGKYLCITPNRLNGPHDISRHFDDIATGFHLKEYTFTELANLFTEVGFRKVYAYVGCRGIYLKTPLVWLRLCEAIFNFLPSSMRVKFSSTFIASAILNIRIIGEK
jgi:SAM-dependent methyltransferase